jgi:hypothetical protein
MRRLLILLVIGLAVASGGLGVASPAMAQEDDNPFGDNDDTTGILDSGVDHFGDGDYETSLRYGADRTSIGAADNPCSYEVHDFYTYQLWWQGFPGSQSDTDPQTAEEPDPDGYFEHPWVIVTCRDDGGGLTFLDGFQAGEPPDPLVLAESARRSLSIPLPVASFSPDPVLGAPQVVGLQTWVWVDPADATDLAATACLPDVGAPFACATVTAQFLDVGFEMGDESAELHCGGPGVAYDVELTYESQSDVDHCSHLYLDADPGGSTYGATASTFWHVTWTCVYDSDVDGALDTGCGSGDLGVIGRTQAPVLLEVLDLQARAVDRAG